MATKKAETGYLVSLTYDEMRALQDVTDRLAQHAPVAAVFTDGPAFQSANDKIMAEWEKGASDGQET
jgi:hypothetical protein